MSARKAKAPPPPQDEELDDDGYIQADGLHDALVGFSWDFAGTKRAVYSVEKVIGVLVERDGMDRDDAVEFYDFNIVGAYIEDGPIFMEFADAPEELTPAQLKAGMRAAMADQGGKAKSVIADPEGWVKRVGLAILGAT